MKKNDCYYCKEMPNKNFCVDIGLSEPWEKGKNFKEHWHEHLQIFYVTNGNGLIRCNTKLYNLVKNDIVVVNVKEMHYLESLNDEFTFFLIRIDRPFLFSNQIDLCQTKYLSPLSENSIIFKNLIRNDPIVKKCIDLIIEEYFKKDIGYELAIKSQFYKLFVLLLRNYVVKFLTNAQVDIRLNNTKRFYDVFEFIDENYDSEISLIDLTNIAYVSQFYFCRLFKDMTGKTVTGYINDIRLKKSIELLRTNTLNITEIAIKCGFNDANYFSRIFKRKFGVSPSKYKF